MLRSNRAGTIRVAPKSVISALGRPPLTAITSSRVANITEEEVVAGMNMRLMHAHIISITDTSSHNTYYAYIIK